MRDTLIDQISLPVDVGGPFNRPPVELAPAVDDDDGMPLPLFALLLLVRLLHRTPVVVTVGWTEYVADTRPPTPAEQLTAEAEFDVPGD
jgi:hypothetical protein